MSPGTVPSHCCFCGSASVVTPPLFEQNPNHACRIGVLSIRRDEKISWRRLEPRKLKMDALVVEHDRHTFHSLKSLRINYNTKRKSRKKEEEWKK